MEHIGSGGECLSHHTQALASRERSAVAQADSDCMRCRAAVDGEIVCRRDQRISEAHLRGEFVGSPRRWKLQPEMVGGTIRKAK